MGQDLGRPILYWIAPACSAVRRMHRQRMRGIPHLTPMAIMRRSTSGLIHPFCASVRLLGLSVFVTQGQPGCAQGQPSDLQARAARLRCPWPTPTMAIRCHKARRPYGHCAAAGLPAWNTLRSVACAGVVAAPRWRSSWPPEEADNDLLPFWQAAHQHCF